ncbi:MAG: hypothetical protein HYX45_17750 [Burkholderiales bacterium]|nr:hypothetical protein [Burkholderiales bacterium]
MKKWIAAASSLLLACGAAYAQTSNYPDKPIKLVVPYAPGGSADITARLISDALAKAVGSTIFIENKRVGRDSCKKPQKRPYPYDSIGIIGVSKFKGPIFRRKSSV